MLPKLLDHNKIGEVIIVDNAKNNKFFRLPKHNKLIVLEQKENIYVNPAWNVGVKHSKFDKICLMNDDIIFDITVFDKVFKFITLENGVIGPNGTSIKSFYMDSPYISVDPCRTFTHGFGTLLFVHKKNYLPIPNELKINFGDVWLYDYNALQYRQNYEIKNLCIKTKMGTSSTNENLSPITKSDDKICCDIFSKLPYTRDGVMVSDTLIHNMINDKENFQIRLFRKIGFID